MQAVGCSQGSCCQQSPKGAAAEAQGAGGIAVRERQIQLGKIPGNCGKTAEKLRWRNPTSRSLEQHLCTGDTQGTNKHARGTSKRQLRKNCRKIPGNCKKKKKSEKCGPPFPRPAEAAAVAPPYEDLKVDPEGASPLPPPPPPLNHLLWPMWDFGPWAASYFSQVCIYALIDDGFTGGFMPEVGFNQDDNVSWEAYQPRCIVVSGTLTVFPEVYIRFMGERLPVNNLMFSDDRCLCAPSLAAAIQLADECVYGTRAKAGTVQPRKLQFYLWTLDGNTMVQQRADVLGYQTTTGIEPPSVVGIPVTHHAYPRARL